LQSPKTADAHLLHLHARLQKSEVAIASQEVMYGVPVIELNGGFILTRKAAL